MVKMNKEPLGYHFGKRDFDRCGLFSELGFLHGDKYERPTALCHRSVGRGKQFSLGMPTSISTGYFGPCLKSINVGDKYIDPWKRQQADTEKNSKRWIAVGQSKMHATCGDNFGTFTSKIEAFSPLPKQAKSSSKEPRNFIVFPAKKGGPGFVDITISKYPKYESTKSSKKDMKFQEPKMALTFHPKPYFETGNLYGGVSSNKPRASDTAHKPEKIFIPSSNPKRPGNSHDGCFSKFPEWQPEKYKFDNQSEKAEKGKFLPWGHDKTDYFTSVVNHKIKSACNATTYETMKPITYPQYKN